MKTITLQNEGVGLKEIPFGTPMDDPDGYCIYVNGHDIEVGKFLDAVHAWDASEVPEDARKALTVDDVERIRFRSMSPSEARGHGLTWGVIQTHDGTGYPVTAVKL
jgi:hypothetical protein